MARKQTEKKTDTPARARRSTKRSEPTSRRDEDGRGKKRGGLNKIGALWITSGRNGKFMSGRIELNEGEEIRILVFKNDYKEQSKHPDYNIFEPESETESGGREEQSRGRGKADYDDSDIPF